MWNWISVGGGDGFQTQVDPTDPNIFYTESQNGNINRYDLNTGQVQSVRPALPARRRGGGGGGARWRGGGGRLARQAAAAGGAPAGGAPAQAGGGQGGGRGRGNVINTPEPARSAVQLELADPALAAQPEHAALRRTPALHLARPRRDLGDVAIRSARTSTSTRRSILEQPYALPSCGAGRGGGPNPNRGKPCILSKHDGYVAERVRYRSPRSPSRRSFRASSGPAPTTATCR